MKYLIYLIIFISTQVSGEVTLSIGQSSPDFDWYRLKTPQFEIVYPLQLQDDAQKALSYLEYFSPMLKESFKTPPSPIYLILRPDMATPNGFVTLGPRRTEWYDHQSISPIVGSLGWLQSLAVHEYRHVMQYDFLSQTNTKWGYYFMGEYGLNILIHLIAPTWFFEGDAVWAETKYTDAGRGRSPRFSERLKAMVLSDQMPSYDELLAGNYLKTFPSLYNYGYHLITRASNLYGDNFWAKVGLYAQDRPYNVYAFYDGFERYAGISFKRFYNDTWKDLKQQWSNDDIILSNPKGLFTQRLYPKNIEGSLYYLEKIDGNYWTFNKDKKVLTELNITPSISKVDISKKGLLFAQTTPHFRYSYKEEQNIFFYSHEEDDITQITHNKKLFHPQFSPDRTSFLAIDKKLNNKFDLVIYTLNGELLHSISLDGENFAEASYIDETSIIATVISEDGRKYLAKVNLIDKTVDPLSSLTRNNIYNLISKKENIWFEADLNGAVNIFKYDLKNNKLFQCSNEPIMGQTPSIDNSEMLLYAATHFNSQVIQMVKPNCKEQEKDILFTQNNYISKNDPSDHHIKYLTYNPIILDQKSKEVRSTPANSFAGMGSPHSWSFIGDRGWTLEGDFQNQLGSTQMNLYAGSTAEEDRPFVGGEFLYSKYFPIFYLGVDYLERSLEKSDETKSNWSELRSSLGVYLPFIHSKNLYSTTFILGLEYGEINVTENDYTRDYYLNDERIQYQRLTAQLSFTKDLRKREIFPRWGVTNESFYTNIDQDNITTANYSFRNQLDFYLPGFKDEHGVKFGYTIEQRPDNYNFYKLQENYTTSVHYTLSRGHDFINLPKFQKYSFDYAFNLFFTHWNFKDWIYINRIYAKIFVDYTRIDHGSYDLDLEFDTRSLNSQGIELYFDSNTLRKLPLTYGLRYIHTNEAQDHSAEVFLATSY